MKAFVVSVNGKRCCTAGVDGFSCITAEMGLVIGIPEGDCWVLRLRGVDISSGALLEWEVAKPKLTDRIEFEVIETNKVDQPSKRLNVE